MIYIYERFEKLDSTKQQSIINAGFMVFAENGYKNASIDQIIQEANISKGSLFYYFKSKKNFFIYLYEYCGVQMEHLIDHPGDDGLPAYMKFTDFFDRLKAIQYIKFKHKESFPHMSRFMKKAVFETDPAVKEDIKKINQRYSKERTLGFLENIDYSKFKEGIDPRMVIQLIAWCSEGCANQILLKEKMKPTNTPASPDFNEIYSLYDTYVELLRNNFYKEEYL